MNEPKGFHVLRDEAGLAKGSLEKGGLESGGTSNTTAKPSSLLSRSLSVSQTRTLRFRITCDEDFYTLGLVGNTSWLGAWDLSNTIHLTKERDLTEHALAVWTSPTLEVPFLDRTPFRYRVVANGGRSSPNKRPLLWDVRSRHVYEVKQGGVVEGSFLLHSEGGENVNAVVDSGWVHRGGPGHISCGWMYRYCRSWMTPGPPSDLR